MEIVNKKNWYFGFSFLIIIPGIISLFLWGLRLSIDFTGGSRLEYQIPNTKYSPRDEAGQIPNEELKKTIESQGVEVVSFQQSQKSFIIRTKPLEQQKHQQIKKAIELKFKDIKEEGFQTIGPTIGSETTINAIKAVAVASILIVLYIAWSFRKVPKPASSWRFGICAIAALIHDVLLVIGVFSLLGHFWHIEVDSLFVTALLTVIGFSVHDTIVVFDRIRENLRRMPGMAFATIVDESINQTLVRSLNTSFTVLLVLFTMLLFGGESIRWFIVALFIGIASGTYSSIFNAAPLLVVWEEWSRKRFKN